MKKLLLAFFLTVPLFTANADSVKYSVPADDEGAFLLLDDRNYNITLNGKKLTISAKDIADYLNGRLTEALIANIKERKKDILLNKTEFNTSMLYFQFRIPDDYVPEINQLLGLDSKEMYIDNNRKGAGLIILEDGKYYKYTFPRDFTEKVFGKWFDVFARDVNELPEAKLANTILWFNFSNACFFSGEYCDVLQKHCMHNNELYCLTLKEIDLCKKGYTKHCERMRYILNQYK